MLWKKKSRIWPGDSCAFTCFNKTTDSIVNCVCHIKKSECVSHLMIFMLFILSKFVSFEVKVLHTLPCPLTLIVRRRKVDLCGCGCPEEPLLYPLCRACQTGWCIPPSPPLTPSPPPSFMMETDTNTVIGFRDKLFTLPVLSAAASLLRGRPFYKWPLFLDLTLLIDPWQRQYMCDWESGEDCTLKVQRST